VLLAPPRVTVDPQLPSSCGAQAAGSAAQARHVSAAHMGPHISVLCHGGSFAEVALCAGSSQQDALQTALVTALQLQASRLLARLPAPAPLCQAVRRLACPLARFAPSHPMPAAPPPANPPPLLPLLLRSPWPPLQGVWDAVTIASSSISHEALAGLLGAVEALEAAVDQHCWALEGVLARAGDAFAGAPGAGQQQQQQQQLAGQVGAGSAGRCAKRGVPPAACLPLLPAAAGGEGGAWEACLQSLSQLGIAVSLLHQ